MIICPSCKEEIDEDSRYCDQCGKELVYCSSCGRVGMGRRCTYCGGLMITADEMEKQRNSLHASSQSAGIVTMGQTDSMSHGGDSMQFSPATGVPTLTLYNPSLDIRLIGINGAVIGRRQGPYQKQLEGNMYISGVHAQLIYKPDTGWSIIDKHSSNGTKLNQRSLMPDIPMSLKSGDIVTLANVNLQVSIV